MNALLELDLTHYTRWCKTYIINNPWAVSVKDYRVFTMDGERETSNGNPNPTMDYKLTANVARIGYASVYAVL